MNNYNWIGLNSEGKKLTGQNSATGPADLKMKLRNHGITPLQVKLISNYSHYFQRRIKNQTITDFLHQLATLISSQIPIVTALEIIMHGQSNIHITQVLEHIKNEVANGIGLGAALAQYPTYFTELTCALITAGEESGTLDNMLNRLVNYLQNIARIKNNTVKILLYPITVIIVTVLVTLFLLIVAVPQFENLFSNLNAPLPQLTKYLLIISRYVQNDGIFIFLQLILTLGVLILCWLKSKSFAIYMQYLTLKIPFIGSIIRKIIIIRIAHTLATMLSSGIPLIHSLQITSPISGNSYYAKALDNAINKIATGTTLHEAFAASKLFPLTMIQMIAIGEESGTLDKMLYKIADWYSDQNEQLISKISILLEPLIMLILAIVIGSIIVAMYLPIFKLGTAI